MRRTIVVTLNANPAWQCDLFLAHAAKLLLICRGRRYHPVRHIAEVPSKTDETRLACTPHMVSEATSPHPMTAPSRSKSSSFCSMMPTTVVPVHSCPTTIISDRFTHVKGRPTCMSILKRSVATRLQLSNLRPFDGIVRMR